MNDPTHPTPDPGHPPEPRFDVEAEVMAPDGGSDAHYDLCGTFTAGEADPPAPDAVVPGQGQSPWECFTTDAAAAGPLDPDGARAEWEQLWAGRLQALLGDARALPPDGGPKAPESP